MAKKSHILPPLLKPPPRKHPWHFFPPCAFSPKTLSFRASDDIFRTVNSVFFDPVETPDPWFTTSSESAVSFTTEDDEDRDACTEESLEMVVRGVRSSSRESERLFFDPDDTRSILEQAKAGMGFPFKESEVLAMESEDPYGDFRRSMEEVVESHGVRDWEGLEELLGWYLKVNGKNNHGFIVEAFVDLLVSLRKKNYPVSDPNSDSPSSTSNYSSAISSFSSSSSLRVSHSQEALNEIADEDDC
ncbi:transcription repressor OFP13-like [Prosopis cineraria]|uniref:transcription repressor OFP13-like n=1 Tax=Prosopis cineraria TaxID=364024 RepID=UPI00240F8E63|nr:transcription repressor OFP13-like [Prosopis cineraria]